MHDKAIYAMPVQNTVCIFCKTVPLFFRRIGIQACYISFALLKTGAVTFANWHLWPAFDISGGFAISPFQIALQGHQQLSEKSDENKSFEPNQ